jgi:phosphoribosylamine--glycine ligase
MQILIVGGGGREHALAWKIAQSPLADRLFCAPGNAGIARLAECVPLNAMDLDGLVAFARQQQIDLTVVGPEAPLAAGLVDRFEAQGLRIFGPSADPARIEGSKVFAKKLMQAAQIPTADFWVCDTLDKAKTQVRNYYRTHPPETRLVIKADGLAAGKGVVVAANETEALAAVEQIMGARVFGASGDQVVIEECLTGEEASIMAITDGETVVPLVPSQDHKRIFDNDRGPNTGGMGAYAPVPILPPDIALQVVEQILHPAILAIRELGIPYRGVLYAGIMATADGPKTIEFNCRFGDPETQAALPLLETDLLELMLGVTDCCLEDVPVRWRQGAAVCVVAASGGYPGAFETGKVISGLDEAAGSDCLVFHAGTRAQDGQVLTDGGRVLSVTGLGATLAEAAERAYSGIDRIHFEGMHFRRDIAARALNTV